jgi:valyl-tRNA synthetase
MISEIRSFKNELNISPGSFIDISIEKVKNKSFFKENNIVLKKLGRINSFYNKDINKPAATFVISGDLFKIYFDQTVDLKLIKENLIKRQDRCEEELNKVSQRLANKSFIDRAPKNIVDQEKTNYSELKNNIQKIALITENL